MQVMKHPIYAIAGVVTAVLLGCGGGGAGAPASDPITYTGCPAFASPNYLLSTDPGDGKINIPLKWDSFPVNVYRAPHHIFTFPLSSYDTDVIAKTALDRWVDAVPHGISYTFVPSDPTKGISITFNHLSRPPSAGEPLGVTTLFYNATSGLLHKANTVINYWDGITEAEVRFGLLFTTTHEFGHGLFINGHSPVFADTMYFAASTVEVKTVTQRDANTLASAYCGTFTGTPLTLGRDVEPDTKVTISVRKS